MVEVQTKHLCGAYLIPSLESDMKKGPDKGADEGGDKKQQSVNLIQQTLRSAVCHHVSESSH
jgi:hypothetical protein